METKIKLIKKLRLPESASDSEIKIAYEKQKMTYELIMISTTDDTVKSIAERKEKELTDMAISANITDVQVDIKVICNQDQVINAAYRVLESKQKTAEDLGAMINKLSVIPQTAEVYYLQTLLLLEIDNGHLGCEKALSYIRNALELDKTNESYIALEKGIQSVIDAKEKHDKDLLKQKEEELAMLQEQEKRRKWELFIQRLKAIGMTIWNCYCGLMGCAFQCLCGLCSCMEDC